MSVLTVYLADDDTDDRKFFMEALKEVPVEISVKQFTNGVDLMDALFTVEEMPDAIFLDLHMPLMDGFECLADIRSFPQFEKIKIIVFSTSYNEMEVNQLREDGANHYLQKPNSFQQLKSLLFQCVRMLQVDENPSNTAGEFILLTKIP